MDTTAIQDISISLPQSDVRLLKQMARRMGWVLKKQKRKSPLQISLEEAQRGEVTEYSSVEEFAAKVLGADGIQDSHHQAV